MKHPAPTEASPYEQALSSILVLSERMLALAERAEWMSLIEVEDERQTLMARLSELDRSTVVDDAERAELIRQKLQAILDLNTRIIAMGLQACQALSQEIRKISGGRQVRQAYLSNTG